MVLKKCVILKIATLFVTIQSVKHRTKLLALKEQKASGSHELTNLRDWLLPMLMNGQATVE